MALLYMCLYGFGCCGNPYVVSKEGNFCMVISDD